MHPLCIKNWTWLGHVDLQRVPFLPFWCKLSESLTHHGSRFIEGEAENCRKSAFRCKSGTGPNMQWHGTTRLRFWTVHGADPWFSKEQGLTWKPFMCNFFPFYPCFGSDIFARLFIASPFIEKRIHHGVRAGWPSSTFHTAQDDVKRLLEEFAAYTLAIAKAEVGGMQIRMLYNCVLVNHKFLGRVSSCNCACVVGAYGTSRHLFYLS